MKVLLGKWYSGKYGFEYLYLAESPLTISVWYASPGNFSFRFLDKSQDGFKTIDEAKKAGIAYARGIISKAGQRLADAFNS